jgi:23S rRNA pseudouridine1911/1915/1917 synthase
VSDPDPPAVAGPDAGPTGWLAEEIPAALDGERVDRAVALLCGCTRSEATDVLAAGLVRVRGRVVTKASHRLVEGDELRVDADPHRVEEELSPDPGVEVRVLHADDDVIVIDKPPGLVVHPGPGHRGATLVHGLLARFPELAPADGAPVGQPERPGIVHRLDRGTSGLLVVARNAGAYESLVDQLATHTVERTYTALVWRHPEHPRGVVDAPIGRSRRNPLRMTVTLEGRPSRTHYQVDRTFSDPIAAALLTCELETGRTHQIRVHLASIGHPVVGDDTYGGHRPGFGAPRPFLHARRLSFVHPGTGDDATFTSPLPDDLQAVLDQLS